MKNTVILLAILGSLSLAAAEAVPAVGGGSAEFEAKGPAGLHIVGKTRAVEVKVTGAELSVQVQLASLETGIALRDQHLRDRYLQTTQYPVAILRTPWSGLTLPADGQSVQGKQASGTLTLHGQTHPVTFTYRASRKGDAYQVAGELPLKLADYGITQPSYMGLTVQPGVVTRVAMVVVRD